MILAEEVVGVHSGGASTTAVLVRDTESIFRDLQQDYLQKEQREQCKKESPSHLLLFKCHPERAFPRESPKPQLLDTTLILILCLQ